MSTRATYAFINNRYRSDVTIYIHHDGYPEGAAYYLYRAFLAGNMSAESMIRGNDRAEITQSHDAHGDTEYRYTIDHKKLTVETVSYDRMPDKRTWRSVFHGDWVEFINKNLNSEWLDGDFKPLKRIKIEHGEQVHTPETLNKQLQEDMRLAGCWATNGNDKGANWDTLLKRIKTMKGNLIQFGDPDWV